MPLGSIRKVIEFSSPPEEPRQATPWEWMQGIFDREFPIPRWRGVLLSYIYLIIKKETSASNQSKARILYQYLPRSVRELQQVRRDVLDLLLYAKKGRLSTRLILIPYLQEIQAMRLAINTKIANQFTNPNLNNWDERACNLFLEIQTNLSETSPLYFATLTFRDVLDFETVSNHLADFRDNTLGRSGFLSVGVIAYHVMTPEVLRRYRYRRDPYRPRERRLHIHLLIWPNDGTSRDQIAHMLRQLKHALDRGRHGIGYYRFSKIYSMLDFMKIAAYMAYNHSCSTKCNRGNDWNPIPPRGRILRLPRNDRHYTRWPRFVDNRLSTSKRAWEKAVESYADRMGYDYRGFWIKMYADRIQELVKPEEWLDPVVTGLDGFDYSILPCEPSNEVEQRYELTNPERPRWIVSEEELKALGSLEVYAGALPRNRDIHPVEGRNIKIQKRQRRSWNQAPAIAVFLVLVTLIYIFRKAMR